MSANDVGPVAYTDLGGLSALKREAGTQDAAAVREAARQFESVFTRMLLTSMRAASPGDPLFDSHESGFYRDMFDDQIAVEMSRGKGLGLAEMLVEQLLRAGVVTAEGVRESGAPAAPPPVQARPALPADRDHRSDFIEKFRPFAEQAARKLGVAPEALIGQAALETGWGRHSPVGADGASSHNYFGIKANAGWRGASVSAATLEYEAGTPSTRVEAFRAYESAEAGIADYVRLIDRSPRYQAARGAGEDIGRFAAALQRGGYATDPAYAQKLERVVETVRTLSGSGLKGGSDLPKQSLRSEA
ncbi:MAG: glucosaminidase domain-containing protein [Steroidobacteraceae bacterium]